MKTKLALLGLGLFGVIWAQNQLSIQSGASTTNYTLTQIQKITFSGANTVIHFTNSSSSTFASIGTKWTFGGTSSVNSSSGVSSITNSSSSANLSSVALSSTTPNSSAVSSSATMSSSLSSSSVTSSAVLSSSSIALSSSVSSSSVLSSSSGDITANQHRMDGFKYQIQSNLLSVSTNLASQFRLLRMNGQVYSQSKPSQKEWSVTLGSENLILQVQNTNSTKNYLIQVQK